MRRLLWGLLLMGVLGGVFLTLTTVGQTTTPFQYAYAHRECAPWDGPAWSVVLLDKPVTLDPKGEPKASYPVYIVSVWKSTLPLNTWVALSGNNGNVTLCKGPRQCAVHTGRVRIIQQSSTQVVGVLRLSVPQTHGGESAFPFQARILNLTRICG